MFFVIGICALLVVVLSAAALIKSAARGRTYDDVQSIPHRKVGLVLGCSKILRNGRFNMFFRFRTEAALVLYRAGKVDYLLVSGDNSVKEYNESYDMEQALIEGGVPEKKVYCDYAGFRTLDSVVRAREIFGQSSITVISQKFQNQRAIFIAQHRGIDAIGFNAYDVGAYFGLKTKVREQLARVIALLDVFLLRAKPKYLGPKIEIGATPQKREESMKK